MTVAVTALESTRSRLAAMPDLLEAAVRAIPADRVHWTPRSWDGIPGERFSLAGQVCHLRDIEVDGYRVRIARMLNEDQPDLVSLDGDAIALQKDYARTDLRQALSEFRAARDATMRDLEEVSEIELRRQGTFAEYGRITLRSLLHILASHDLQHLACIEWLAGKVDSEGVEFLEARGA
jgi:hypothetical protein